MCGTAGAPRHGYADRASLEGVQDPTKVTKEWAGRIIPLRGDSPGPSAFASGLFRLLHSPKLFEGLGVGVDELDLTSDGRLRS